MTWKETVIVNFRGTQLRNDAGVSDTVGDGSRFARSHRSSAIRMRPPVRRGPRLCGMEQLEQRLLLAGDQFEPNDTWVMATDLGSDSQTLLDLTIHDSKDEDWFAWTAPSSGTMGVDLRTQAADANLTLVLDSDPAVDGIVGRYSPGTNDEKILATALAGQKYWINVTGGANSEISYALIVSFANRQLAISDIPDQVIMTDTYTRPFPFSTHALASPADVLTFEISSSNPALVPVENVVVSGKGLDRMVSVTPAASKSGRATITISVADGDGRTASKSFTLTVDDVLDSDGDGLLDRWETEGLDVNNDGIIDLDLPGKWGTDPQRKDLFVEVDAMLGSAPLKATLDKVVKAFADAPVKNPDGSTGVRLVIQLDDRTIAPKDFDFASLGNPWRRFEQIKRRYFGTLAERDTDPAENPNREHVLQAKRRVFRYCLFANRRGDMPEASGLAELPGNDFMVTLGSWFHTTNASALDRRSGGSPEQQAAAFMHELGHNLGLQHGGGDDINFKPNYFSVMNYAWQMPSLNYGWRLDYSRERLPTLDERNLDERHGLGFPEGSIHAIERHEMHVGPFPLRRVPLVGAVDWDRDGIVGERHVRADINRFRLDQNADGHVNREDRVLEQLHGYDDWSNLRFTFRDTKNYSEGVHDCPDGDPDCTPDEHTWTDHSKFYSGLEPDAHESNDEHQFATDHGKVDDFHEEGLSIHTPDDVDWFTWEPMHSGLFEVSLTARQDDQVELQFEVLESLDPELDPVPVTPFLPGDEGTPSVYEVESEIEYFIKVYSPDQDVGYFDLTVDGPEIWAGEGQSSAWSDSDHWIIDGVRGQEPTPLDHVTLPVASAATSTVIDLGGGQVVASITLLDDYQLTNGDLTLADGYIAASPEATVMLDVDLFSPSDLRVRGGGTLLVQGTAHANVVIEAGVVGGAGSVKRLKVASGASVSPGQSIGTLTATDSGTDESVTIDGTLRAEIDGTGADLLSANGPVKLLAGTLEVDAIGRLGPFEYGEATRKIVAGTSVEGNFAFINQTEVDGQPLNIHTGHGVFIHGVRYETQSVFLDLLQAAPGDANGDGRFTQLDLVDVLRAEKYKTGVYASWEEGDWNEDGVFDQFDLIAALATGLYLAGQ